MVDYPFYDKQPGPERREKLNELYATWENAITSLIKGDKGWSPLIRAVAYLDRVVLELYDWTGGQGSKPTEVGYLGSAGYVSDISLAIDFRGPLGLKGDAASVSIGTVTTTAPGTNATVLNSGTPSNAVFDFEIPRGDTGSKGDAATISVGTVTTGAAGTAASVTNSGTQNAATFDFTIPRGDKGEQGIQGVKGDTGLKGDKGDTGDAATISVGTVTTGAPGTLVQVVNSGTPSAAVFDFTIPRGEDGDGAGDMLKSVYDTVGDGVVNASRTTPWTGITGKPVVISAGATSADARAVIDAVSSSELGIVADGLDAEVQDRQKLGERVDSAILSFTDYASASAAAATLPDGQVVESPDTHGKLSRYRVQSGVLVFQHLSEDAASANYLPAGVGAVATTVQAKLREVVSVKDFGAVGDGVVDDTLAFQRAINAGVGVTVKGVAGQTYYIASTVFCRTSDVTLDLHGARITTDNFELPVFSLSDPSNTTIAPDNITFRNINAVQTSTVIDIGGSSFYGGQPEDWKVAALIHRGKSIGKTLTVENVSGDNFISLISNWGDWQDETKPSGPLILRKIQTTRCNFGLLDNGCTSLEVDDWIDRDRVAIQATSSGVMPPHAIYSINHDCQKTNYRINNIRDHDTAHGSAVKLRQVSGVEISNVFGQNTAALVELFNCNNGSVTVCDLSNPQDDPAVTLSQSAYWVAGCKNIKWVACNADVRGDSKLVRVDDSTEAGGLVKNEGVYFSGVVNYLSNAYAIMARGGGVSFEVSAINTDATEIGVLRDYGAGSVGLEDIYVNLRSVVSKNPTSLVLSFLSAAGNAKVCYSSSALVNVDSAATSGVAAAIYVTPSGLYTASQATVELTTSDAGVCEFVASRSSAARRGLIRYNHAQNKWEFISNGSLRGFFDSSGWRFALGNSISLDQNLSFGFERVSDTEMRLAMRGSDGVVRKAVFTLS